MQGKDILSISNNSKYMLIIITLLITFMFIAAIQVWTKYFYGKYVKQLKNVLDELVEE